MKILLLEKDFEVRNLLILYLEATLDQISIHEEMKAQNALNYLSKNPDIDIVICDHDLEEGSGSAIFNKIKELKHKAYFILTLNSSFENIKSSYIEKPGSLVLKPYQLQEIRDEIKKGFNEKRRDSREDNREEENDFYKSEENSFQGYCKIRPSFLQKMVILPSDVYVALSSGKMIKVMCKGDYFETTDLIRYETKNLKYLYLKEKDFIKLSNSLEMEFKKLSRLTSMMIEDPILIPSDAHEMAKEIIHKFGFSQRVQDLVLSSVDITLKVINLHPKLSQVFKRIQEFNGHYLSSHSILLAYVSCAISAQMKWLSSSTYEKLCMASFMHDIVLDQKSYEEISRLDKECRRISTSNESSDVLFKNPELMLYYNHPAKACELFNGLEDPIPDVDIIIAQHHERPDGSGFPKRLDALSLSPLSCIMILAHEIVDAFFKDPTNFDLISFINNLDPAYTKGNFKGAIKALTEMHF